MKKGIQTTPFFCICKVVNHMVDTDRCKLSRKLEETGSLQNIHMSTTFFDF